MIGTTNPTAKLELHGDAIFTDTNYAQVVAETFADDVNASGAFITKKGRGTKSVPSYPLDNDVLGGFYSRNYTNLGSVDVVGYASENHSAVNGGGHLALRTTPDGATLVIERMRITSDGDVGIGTTGPADKLHVAGDIRVGTGTTGCVKDADGTVIAGTCSSDVRFKTDIEPLGSRLEQVSQLRPVTYKWRSEEFPDKHFGHETETGLIAQEVQRAIPELVAEDEEGYLKVRFTELNIYILQAVKDLYNRVLGVESHQATQDRQIASKADKAETEALRTEVKAKDQEIAKLKADAEKQKQENAEMKARLDKIEKMLKSK